MDFFEHQTVARRRTGRLIFLFLLALAGIVGMVYLVVTFLLALRSFDAREHPLWQPRVLAQAAAAVLSVIAAGSLWKMRQLARGGGALAERVGGRRLDPASTDPLERRVLNVVEEMAIASGTPVPPVYLLDQERGINAFAAGRDASDAVLGVTRGAVEVLTREELQGVVAHEFSHVLNGDMRLNLELIAIVYGIEMIGGLGGALLRGAGRGAGRGKKAGGAAALGGALWLIGGIGSLFGRLIRAAVSKQREFLADASAVQFTRNPAGVAGALRKIGGFGFGSHLVHPGRSELSHMFFGSALPSWDLSDLFGTHPPLEERIRRIDPSFDGRFPTVPLDRVTSWHTGSRAARGDVAEAIAQFTAGAFPAGRAPLGGHRHRPPVSGKLLRKDTSRFHRKPPRPLLDRLGAAGPEQLERSCALLAGLPAVLIDAARSADGAYALACAMLASPRAHVRDAQQRMVAEALGEAGLQRARVLGDALAAADPAARLALSGLLTGTLSELDATAYERLRTLVGRLVDADGQVELTEWIFTGLVLRQLDARFGRRRPARPRYSRLSGLETEVAFVLSALAHAGNGESTAAERAFAKAAVELRLDRSLMKPHDACTPRALEAALGTLAELQAAQKRRVLAACAAAVASDRRVLTAEAELFRVVASWLECPAPLLLPGQMLA
jgi:Zn-dependent protease with chaperone function